MQADSATTSTEKIHADSNLVIMVVDPEVKRRNALRDQLHELPAVRMVGTRNTHNFLIDTLSESNVDLICFDIETGYENIIDAVRELRSHPNGENVGFMVISNELGGDVKKMLAQVGVLGYLKRPFTEGELTDCLNLALGGVEEGRKSTLAAMRRTVFFSAFTDRELLRLLNICPIHYLMPEKVVFEDGSLGTSMYVVLSGQISIRKEVEGQVKELTTINPGETFGEMAIVDSDVRSASAVAGRESTVFEINHETLHEDDSVLALKLSRQISVMLARKIRAFSYR